MEPYRTINSQSNLEKNNRDGGIMFPDLRPNYVFLFPRISKVTVKQII